MHRLAHVCIIEFPRTTQFVATGPGERERKEKKKSECGLKEKFGRVTLKEEGQGCSLSVLWLAKKWKGHQ